MYYFHPSEYLDIKFAMFTEQMRKIKYGTFAVLPGAISPVHT